MPTTMAKKHRLRTEPEGVGCRGGKLISYQL